MSDRELLELAANAGADAGLPIIESVAGPQILCRKTIDGVEHYRIWNPIEDDGDAFRLAVKLGEKFPCFLLGIFNRSAFPHARASIVHRNVDETYIEQDDNADMSETARRAIVRAAAEIGRTQTAEQSEKP